LCSCFPGWTAKHGRRRTRRAARNLLVLEPRRLERVLHDLGHLDDALLQPGAILLTRGVSYKGCLALTIRYVLGLSGLNLAVRDLLECGTRLVCSRLNLFVGRPLHLPGRVVQVLPVSQRD
jgi:hypothetical protein